MRRFKIDPGTIEGNNCVITGPDARYMVNVLRLKTDRRVVLCVFVK